MWSPGRRGQEVQRESNRWFRRAGVLAGWLVLLAMGSATWLGAQQSIAELALGTQEMIGEVAPPWSLRGWVNSEPLDVGKLRGKVVLLRFFHDSPTGAVGLKELSRIYKDQGLVVVGLYTPYPMPAETELAHVERLSLALGFQFPVGLDSWWETLNRYWLNRVDAELNAATFLIDRNGVIRYVQPDGQYEKNSPNRAWRREYEKLENQIQTLLKEKETEPASRQGEPARP